MNAFNKDIGMNERYIAHRRDDGNVQSIYDHLNGTAKLAKGFADAFGAGEFAYTIAFSHDLGKYSNEFQRRISGENISVDHSTAGGKHLKKLNDNFLGRMAAYCIFGHHGGLPDGGSSVDTDSEPSLSGRLIREVPDYSAFSRQLDIPPLVPPNFRPDSDGSQGFSLAFLTRMVFSALVDADWLDTEEFMSNGTKTALRGGFDEIETLHGKLMEHLKGFQNPTAAINIRRTELLRDCMKAAENPSGLFTLTAPTGSGKTLSSIAFALAHARRYGKERIIYVIPYNTIIEQNAKVFEGIFGEENVLQHHSGIQYKNDENDPDYPRLLATGNWDAPIIVTSSVRFFESLYANKPSACRKLHNIANSVIVFDEAQMIPLPYLIPCVNAIKELVSNYGCTAVLATATQSSLDEYFAPLVPTEITQNPRELYEFFRRVTFEVISAPLSDEEIAAKIAASDQVLCVVNTRKRAQTIADMLGEGEDIFHLSTTMYPAHRSRVLDEIRRRLKEGECCKAVSTSMIEAGVDVDFPVVYREKAGLDSVIQAAGRCNREGENETESSMVYIFTAGEDVPTYINQNIAAYEHAVRNHDDVGSLDAIRTYFEQLRYIIGSDGLDKNSAIQQFNEGARSFLFPFKDVAKHFRLIDDNTRAVIISVEEEAKNLAAKLRGGERSRELFQAVQKYSVSLYENDLKKLDELGAVERIDEEILVLHSQYYDKRYGVTLAPEGGQGIFCE
jgi:CRISPR-associated endonuclease/helicase Cas3